MELVFVLATAVTLGLVGAWTLVFLLRRIDPGSHDEPSRWMAPSWVVPGAVAAVALIGLLGISRLELGTEAPTVAEQSDGGGREGRYLSFLDDRNSPVRGGEGRGDGPMAPLMDSRPVPVALLVLLVGGVALAWWRLGRRNGEGAEGGGDGVDTDAARGTVLRSIEAMLSDPDPNTAVIGAYARLLEGLAASGVPRRDYEAPVEHLRRALAHLRVRPGPVRRLVGLFEVARFSTQALAMEHRDQALSALREVASELGHGTVAPSRSTLDLSGETGS
ncbi:MAG: DUF4129 domain-containing protein [Deltaproteobacteria bacterium]|nr:DUF4129 domain-containing protein [Deltaproteobacteria bacterium]